MQNIFKLGLSLLVAILFPLTIFPQNAPKYSGDTTASVSEIIIPAQARIEGHFDLFYQGHVNDPADKQPAFWYKFVFNKKTTFKLNSFPLKTTDRYTLYMYRVKHNAPICEADQAGLVEHINNILVGKDYKNNEQPKEFREGIVYTREIQVEKDDAIYLAIVNLKGNNCGHIVDFNSTEDLVLKIINDDCSKANCDKPAGTSRFRENQEGILKQLKSTLCNPENLQRLSAMRLQQGHYLTWNIDPDTYAAEEKHRVDSLKKTGILPHLLTEEEKLAARKKSIEEDCTNATGITVGQSGITLNADKSEFNEQTGVQTIYYKENDRYTFWYKVKAEHDGEIYFKTSSLDNADQYGVFAYHYSESGNFCKDLISRKIVPMPVSITPFQETRSLSKNQSSINDETLPPKGGVPQGWGADHSAPHKQPNEGHNDNFLQTMYSDDTRVLYHHEGQNRVLAKAGDVFYVNVYHRFGEDCGHSLDLSSNNMDLNLRALNKPCFEEPEKQLVKEEKPSEKILATKSQAVVTYDTDQDVQLPLKSVFTGMLKDSIKEMPVQGELKLINNESKSSLTITANDNGQFQFPVQDEGVYTVMIDVMGYRQKMTTIDLSHEKEKTILLTPLKAGDNFVLKDIYFYPNTYAFRKESDPQLERLLSFMKKNEETNIEIQGHTNGHGKVKADPHYAHNGEAWNFTGSTKKLSRLRAEALKNYLIENGIPQSRITATGMGDKKMLYPNPVTREQADMNKRVEILLIK